LHLILAIPEYNKRKLDVKVQQVKKIMEGFSYLYNRRIAGAYGRFTKKDYRDWLHTVEKSEIA
jgi:hypothetical protein